MVLGSGNVTDVIYVMEGWLVCDWFGGGVGGMGEDGTDSMFETAAPARWARATPSPVATWTTHNNTTIA